MMPNRPGTQGYNLYAYAENNPMTWADPSGYDANASSAPFLSGYSIREACLLTPSCGAALVFFLGLAKGWAEAIPYQGTIVGDVGTWLLMFGTIGVLFEELDCAIDFSLTLVNGSAQYGGCGGLAHEFQLLINKLGSAGPVFQKWTKQELDNAKQQLPLVPLAIGRSCKDIANDINDAVDVLAKRAKDIETNPRSLPLLGSTMTVASHQKAFGFQQARLVNLLKQWDTKKCDSTCRDCPPLAADAKQWAAVKPPIPGRPTLRFTLPQFPSLGNGGLLPDATPVPNACPAPESAAC